MFHVLKLNQGFQTSSSILFSFRHLRLALDVNQGQSCCHISFNFFELLLQFCFEVFLSSDFIFELQKSFLSPFLIFQLSDLVIDLESSQMWCATSGVVLALVDLVIGGFLPS